jgi:hypothetical protein
MGRAPGAEVTGGLLLEDFQNTHESGVFQFDTCDARLACKDRFGQTCDQIELTVDIEMLSLEVSEAVGDLEKAGSDVAKMNEGFAEFEVFEIVADDLQAQERRRLFVSFEEGVAAIGSKDVLTMVDPFDDRLKYAQVAAALEDRADGPTTLENEVAAVFDLTDGVEAVKAAALAPFFGGELWAEDEGPVVDAPLEGGTVEAIGGPLEGPGIRGGNEAVVVLLEGDALAKEFTLDEVVAVAISGDLKREEGANAQDHRAKDFIDDVKVIVGETAALFAQDTVIGILGGVLGLADGKGRALFHALEDEIDPEGSLALKAIEPRADVLLLANSLFRPLDWDVVIGRKALNPSLVIVGALAE